MWFGEIWLFGVMLSVVWVFLIMRCILDGLFGINVIIVRILIWSVGLCV